MLKSSKLAKISIVHQNVGYIFHKLPKISSFSASPTVDDIIQLILDQKSPSEALQTFRWASKTLNFDHQQSTYRALIYKLCSFRKFDTAKNILYEIPLSIGSPPDETIFITIVRGLDRAGRSRETIKVIKLVRQFGTVPSLKIFNSILNALVKVDIDLARAFFRKKMMASGVEGDEYTFGILMKGLCLTNRIGDGFKLLQLMKSRNFQPNTVIYNTLIHALCKNGKVGRGRSLINEMNGSNDVTFNILISGYCKEGKLIHALVLLEKSFSLGFVPDTVTVTKLVEILCNEGRVSEAIEVLARVEKKGGLADIVAYNTLIGGFCKLGKPKVGYKLVKEMERKGCLANLNTYNVLISGFCNCGMLEFALDLFLEMEQVGVSPNFFTYDELIKGLCVGGRVEDGLKLLDLMEERNEGQWGYVTPYNSIIYGMYKEQKSEQAYWFLVKMEQKFPRLVDRCLKIFALCEENNVAKAKKVYDQMVGEGGIPNALVFDRLIDSFCQEGELQLAFDLMNEMVLKSYLPVRPLFNSLIIGFCRKGMVESALKLIKEMLVRHCLPDCGSYNPLIDTFIKNGETLKASWVLNQMVEKNIIPNGFTWKSLVASINLEEKCLYNEAWVQVKTLLDCTG